MIMRKNKGVNANMNFLFGGVLLFFVLVLIVGLFSFFTLQQFWHSDESVKVAEVTKRYDYSVAFDSSFKGKSYKLYLNDSLVYVGTPVDVDTVIKLRRVAVDNSLLVVDGVTDAIAAIVELGVSGAVNLKCEQGAVAFYIKE